MLTIAEASGLIAAAVVIGKSNSPFFLFMSLVHSVRSLTTLQVQNTLPAAFVVILVKYLGTENSAVTWYQCPHG
jgi:hypothetical protein